MFSSVKFPLYKNDGRASIYLNSYQKRAVSSLKAKLQNGTYKLRETPCMCGASDDVVVSEKDRYGLPCKNVLCRHCGLVRQEKILDDESTALFYRDDYREIYTSRATASDKFFQDMFHQGERIYAFVSSQADISEINTVFEAGCSAGGNLYAFHKQGKKVSGCDYGEKYIAYGQALGMALYAGEPDFAKTPPNSQNLVILSHVLEHLNNPLEYVNTLTEIISPGGYLYVQVPGIFVLKRNYIAPIRYFQNAHVNNFYCHYLRRFFTVLGLEVIYGDEDCTFLLRKPEAWTKKDAKSLKVWDSEMPEWSRKVEESLKRDYVNSHMNLKYMCKKTLDFLRLTGIVKKLIGR